MATKTAPTDAQIKARLDELKLPLDPSIRYHWKNLFPQLDGWFINSTIKTKAKLVRSIEPTLKQMLRPGEEVLYIARGVQQAFLEAMFMGAMWAQMLNQTGFVFTNARVLMMRINSTGKPQKTFWMIYYSEIKSLKGGWAGSLSLKLVDGRNLTFGGFPKVDRVAIEQVFEEAVERYQATGFDPETTQSLEDLCCHCFDAVPKKSFACPECGATFWTPSQLAVRSLIFPSWGDFLMGHYLFAVFELLGYLIGLAFVVAIVTGVLDPNAKVDPVESLIIVGAFFTGAHFFDSFITYIVANKGLHPRRGPVPDSGEDLEAFIGR